jgi:hypothetical protein
MNVLAIGNSFSQDATRYLNKIAKADNFDMMVVNLYIGGCSLKRHYLNIEKDAKEYELEYNGENTGFYVSIKEALTNRVWDYITLQQVSQESINYETYQPYLNAIVEFINNVAPSSKIVLHQTWAYESGSDRLCKELMYKDQGDMFDDLKQAYNKAANEICANMIIPSGELFQSLIRKGIKVHRDTFHATYGIGRYALGLLWYHKLTGKKILTNSFCEFDEYISNEDINCIKSCIEEF